MCYVFFCLRCIDARWRVLFDGLLSRCCLTSQSDCEYANLGDLIYLYTALFMYDYYSNRLPLIFDNFFMSINKVHQYQTRLASKISYYLPKARTNYGKFNIRFFGAKVWNSIDESLKSKSRACFKNLLKELIISNY